MPRQRPRPRGVDGKATAVAAVASAGAGLAALLWWDGKGGTHARVGRPRSTPLTRAACLVPWHACADMHACTLACILQQAQARTGYMSA
eukprot:366488-Chlamydomonas_euryale.AAC.6